MDISPRNGAKRSSEPLDEWLKDEGYFRKNLPHDATCLFRAVSEQVYLTQYYHLKVRQECVDFIRNNKQLFEEDVKIPIDNYLEQLSCVTEWGGHVEIQAMALLYKRDFVVFHAQKLNRLTATNHGFGKIINLCQMTAKIYESVFKRDIIAPAAFCQSLVYQTLYKNVFGMPEINDTIQKMLHDRTTNVRHDKFFLRNNIDQRDKLSTDLFNKLETATNHPSKSKCEKAPFPYRIAKALDPNIYRNIDFDIWHEIRREVRCAGWTRWNDAELQIGAKCLVQLDYNKENIDDANNNNSQLINADNFCENSNSKEVPALLIGHIQEMSKNEGPVVVFIEELGEKQRVPYAALKPLLATRKPQLPLGVVSPRKTWKNKWTNPNQKSKDSAMINDIDVLNNNDYNGKGKKNLNEWNDDANSDIILKSFTSVENCSENNRFINTIEVRPVSIILDNPQPLLSGGNEPKEDHIKSPLPSNNNNNPLINNNNINQTESYEKAQSVGQGHDAGNVPMSMMQPTNQASPVAPYQEPYYAQSVGPVYAPSTNVMCVSSEGAMYPVQYYGGGASDDSSPGLTTPDRGIRPINISAPFSNDINGNDLPYSDPATLRFFYNLGIESFRYGHMWQPSGPVTYGPPYIPPGNVVPIVSPVMTADAPQSIQTSPRHPENLVQQSTGRQNNQQNRRKNEQSGNPSRNSGMSGDSRGNSRNNYSRKNENDGNFQRNETASNPHDYQKHRAYGNNDDKDGNRDQRKNIGVRCKKNNEGFPNSSLLGRNRNFDRNSQFQQDYYKSRDNSQSIGFRNHDNHTFQRGRNESVQLHSSQPSPMTPGGSNQFQQPYGQPPVYNNLQYYPNESDNYYAPAQNFYPVQMMAPPPETPENGNVGSYVCAGPENFPPPMYSPYVFPPPSIYSGVPPAIPQDNWYPMPGTQNPYVPYQVPVTQPPPNISNRPPTTS